MTLETPPPAAELTVKVGDKDLTVLMHFNLLRRVAAAVGNRMGVGEDAMTVFLFEGDRMAALIDLLIDPKGFNPNIVKDHDITHEQALELISWAIEHTIHFFARGMESAQKVSEKLAPLVVSLMPSADGSKGSPLTTPAAGPSTAAGGP